VRLLRRREHSRYDIIKKQQEKLRILNRNISLMKIKAKSILLKLVKFRERVNIILERMQHFGASEREIEHINRAIRTAITLEVLMENIISKLEIIHEINEAVLVLAPIMGVLDKVRDIAKSDLFLNIIVKEIDELRREIYTTLLLVSGYTTVTIEYYARSSEVERILYEAKTIAMERLKNYFNLDR